MERLERIRDIGWVAVLGLALLVFAAAGAVHFGGEVAAAVWRWTWRR